jgi:hypothetical protein
VNIEERIQRTVESILENERLTADLDDDAAQVLLDWGTSCAKRIAQGSLGLNDTQAEETMYQPMRATRRLMSTTNKWIARYDIFGEENHAESLQKIIEQAGIIYGQEYIPPASGQQSAFLMESHELISDIPGMISKLRTLVENEASASSPFA